jgi:hypothetical protein
MTDDSGNMLHEVQEYRDLVLKYEALDEQVDALIMAHGGVTEHMAPADLEKYRKLARERDEVLNEMRVMEQALLSDDSAE